jgi:hypothetical protein
MRCRRRRAARPKRLLVDMSDRPSASRSKRANSPMARDPTAFWTRFRLEYFAPMPERRLGARIKTKCAAANLLVAALTGYYGSLIVDKRTYVRRAGVRGGMRSPLCSCCCADRRAFPDATARGTPGINGRHDVYVEWLCVASVDASVITG